MAGENLYPCTTSYSLQQVLPKNLFLDLHCSPRSIFFQVKSRSGFIPTANTCINNMKLPRPSYEIELPSEEELFALYDYAFLNTFYGLIWITWYWVYLTLINVFMVIRNLKFGLQGFLAHLRGGSIKVLYFMTPGTGSSARMRPFKLHSEYALSSTLPIYSTLMAIVLRCF